MCIEVNHKKQYLDIWLAYTEDVSQSFVDDFRVRYPRYTVVVWRSGRGDLIELTRNLLECNR